MWAEWRGPRGDERPRKFTQGGLAELLRPFGDRPRKFWITRDPPKRRAAICGPISKRRGAPTVPSPVHPVQADGRKYLRSVRAGVIVIMPITGKQLDAVIAILAACFPNAFALYQERRRPLKIGIHLDIVAAIGPVEHLSPALGHYTRNIGYLRAQKAGVPRIDLDGNEAGVVDAEQARTRCGRLLGSVPRRCGRRWRSWRLRSRRSRSRRCAPDWRRCGKPASAARRPPEEEAAGGPPGMYPWCARRRFRGTLFLLGR